MLSNSINLGLILFENQLFNVWTVNFNSTEKRSARDVDISQARTNAAASLSWWNVVLSKNSTCSCVKWPRS